MRELQESQAEAQDPEVQFAAAAALCVPLMQPAAATITIKQTPAAPTHSMVDTESEQTAAVSALGANFVQCHDQAADAEAPGHAAVAAGLAHSGAPSVEPGSDDTGLAVLIHVLSSPRATANPTHVYMLLRLLDAASKLKVCAVVGTVAVGRSGVIDGARADAPPAAAASSQAVTGGMLVCPAPLAAESRACQPCVQRTQCFQRSSLKVLRPATGMPSRAGDSSGAAPAAAGPAVRGRRVDDARRAPASPGGPADAADAAAAPDR